MKIPKTKLLRPVANLLINTKDNIIVVELSKRSKINYCHTVNILKELEKNNLIHTKKIGRKKHLYLTDKGNKLKQLTLELVKELKRARRK